MSAPATVRLEAGQPAPDFSLPGVRADGSVGPVPLSAYRGDRVVLYAYPAAGTPGCTRQACDFRDALHDFEGAGLAVVGISPDPVEALARFRADEGLTFALVSDEERSVLAAYGAWGQKQNYGRTVTGVIRSTFVVDGHGDLERVYYNVKATGHVDRLRRDLGLA